ncbi:P1 family peptidase [Amaricoccus solimangrovi]|uniref:P1 family peptidase n=1 Tax=Amaricoccus solimangrovi TaxID=2589815 RepID=A0A501WXF4_9RHOB|nr:P1 family peptidase [Amaricoccus solimangrovi]TPE53939.1 P1 family peptidase [Amaricoccus solimangrovi]
MSPGPRNLITDVPGLVVGNASDAGLKSGVTVLTAEAPFTAAVDIRGGAPGTRESALLEPGRLVETVDALVLSGGSAFGLDAASGVMEELRARGRGFAVGDTRVPIVPAAILFDLLNGGAKDWAENPYPALGRAALRAAGEDFALGTAGAGTGATTATVKGGLGSASLALPGGATVGALVAVNAMGGVLVPGTRKFWAAPFEIGDEFGGLGAHPDPVPPFTARPMKPGPEEEPARANTTIAIVATDAGLDKAGAFRLAVAAHDGLARAIVPAHTPFDGDLVFGVSTGARPVEGPLEQMRLCHAAAVCLARAVARAVHAAAPERGDRMPCWSRLPD